MAAPDCDSRLPNPNVLTYSRRTGLGLGGDLNEANQGDFFIRLKDGRREPIDTVMEEIRAKIEHDVPGIDVEMAQLMEDLIGDLTAVPQPVQIKIFSDDPKVLYGLATRVADALGKIAGVVDVREGINPAGDALLAAGRNRLRPIAMTTVAAILALLPLVLLALPVLLEISIQKR